MLVELTILVYLGASTKLLAVWHTPARFTYVEQCNEEVKRVAREVTRPKYRYHFVCTHLHTARPTST